MTELTIPMPPLLTLGLAVFALFMFVSFLVLLTARLKEESESIPSRLQSGMGLGDIPAALFILAATLWGALFLVLCAGLVISIFEIIWAILPKPDDVWNWRFSLVKLTALTTVLAAVIALPFTLIRLKLTRDQNKHAGESLYNDKMNNAVGDLYAQRQVTKWVDGKAENGWEDDIARRNGAIDRLKGLADESPDLRLRVDRLLSVYLRELSREFPAKVPPEGGSPKELQEWAAGLRPARSDMENAAQTLGRLDRREEQTERERDNLPDLRGMNLQKFDLTSLSLANADLSDAQLQGTDLSWAELNRADLTGAELQGADLFQTKLQKADLILAKLIGARLVGSELQGANLTGAQLQGADLHAVELQGADLRAVQFDAETNLSAASLHGAMLMFSDLSNVPQITEHLDALFGDITVKLPEGIPRPARFDISYDESDAFITAWRAFQRSIGQDPDDPN